ncbi:MAG: acyltransferase [Tannerella sp.]|jgi:acetyltransferase-like isoleucine patch superfamily enzyme|nr:acyltransferase [Tannerella sp.]
MWKKLIFICKRIFWTPERYARSVGVQIGKNCAIATFGFGSEPYLIQIGDHCQITTGVKFFTHGGGWVFRSKYPDFDTFGKIIVKDNVYIGNNSLIMPGVTINSNVIIGAGSVVTKSVQSGKIVAGNPAKIIGDLDDLEKRLIPYNLNTKKMNYLTKKTFLLSVKDEMFISK